MAERPYILLVDDEPEFLAMYRDLLAELPSHPEVHSTNSGAKAIAMLESVAYSVMVCDLKMPAMDGLQVLAIVRRKYPSLRTVIITGLVDEQFRIRAYSMGVDLFIGKPKSTEENQRLMDCIESLLDLEQQTQTGFRGVQQKSLSDIIQLECLCQSSSVLRIHGPAGDGTIWFTEGQIIDAEAPGFKGEEAFRKILSWKTGNFEILPAEPNHARTIHDSAQGLMLSSAQAFDESVSNLEQVGGQEAAPLETRKLHHYPNVQMGVIAATNDKVLDSWALDAPDAVAQWLVQTLTQFQAAGQMLGVGDLRQIEAHSIQHRALLARRGEIAFMAACDKGTDAAEQQATFNRIMTQWES